MRTINIEDGVMQHLYDVDAPKKATNLSINSDLLKKARGLKINLSATLEQALALQVKSTAHEAWLKDNKAAIDALNDLSAKNGLFSDSYREL